MALPLFDHVDLKETVEPPLVLRVSEVNHAARLALEDRWGDIWVQGEVSDLTRAASGHLYFTLNDDREAAQLRCVMFRNDAARAKAQIERGAIVRVRGTLSIYEPRGMYQFIAKAAVPAGAGDLHAAFERLRKKLEAEGLFDPARKRPLPLWPRVIGVVTSASGAALHDIVRVAKDRCPVRIVVSDCRVQGEGAPKSIVEALEAVQRLEDLEVIILGRGGGSAEDLWSFSDESVVRAIAASRVPVVSAVGHEVDVTLADFVADVRAATPSNAAELVVPDGPTLARRLQAHERQLTRAVETQIDRGRLRVEQVARKLRDPRHTLGSARRQLDRLAATLGHSARRILRDQRARLTALTERTGRRNPRALLEQDRRKLSTLAARIAAVGQERVRADRSRYNERVTHLNALSPLAVLARGYAIALHASTGRALVDAGQARAGDALQIRLHRGSLEARVDRAVVREEGE